MTVSVEQRPSAPGPESLPAKRPGISNLGDRIFKGLCQSASLLIVLISVLLVLVLIKESGLGLEVIGLDFFTSKNWNPPRDKYGALAFIYGTLITSAIAMLIAVPLGVGTAAYLSEIASGWLRRIVTFLVEMLASIPSVVYGFWGIFVLAPLVQEMFTWLGGPNHGGRGILSCSLILAVMIVPYVTAVSYDVCRAVPSAQRQAALALGATRWQAIRTAVLPFARPGIAAACFIALGRALGETMAATMLIGGSSTIDFSLFAMGDTIASRIANSLPSAQDPLTRSALIELGLILLLVTTAVNTVARLLIWRMGSIKSKPSLWERLWGSGGQNGHAAPPLTPQMLTANARRSARVDRVMTGVLGGCVACTVGPLFFILGYLVYKGFSSLRWEFFTELPLSEPHSGMANALYGSAMMVTMASLMAVPVGLLAAIYLAEYRNGRLAHSVRFIGELLGGVPSIVIGIFGYTLVVLPLKAATDGSISFCAWAGAFALGVMMLPIVMRASEEALRLVPRSLRNASMALGANNWQTVMRITVPAALPAIVTAIFLAVARIAGETAPLLLTAGDNFYWPKSPNDFTPSIPVMIYNYSSEADKVANDKAWAAALVLMVLVLLLNFGIRWIAGKRVVLAARAD